MFNDISPEGYSSPLLPFTPLNQTKSASDEREATLAQVPLLKEVIKHLDSRIAATDSIKQAMVIADEYEIERETALVALNIVRQQLDTERSYIQARVDRAK